MRQKIDHVNAINQIRAFVPTDADKTSKDMK